MNIGDKSVTLTFVEVRLHLRNTQINLVFHSVCTNFVPDFRMFYEYSMTLRELLQSVDAEAYASIPLYEKLLKTKPEYGSSNRIKVKVLNGEIAVSNVHVGSLGDIVACPIDVAPDLQVTKMQLLDAILNEMSHV